MSEDFAERVFPAKTEQVPEVIGFVARAAKSAGLHPKRLLHLELAVEEAVMNISNHAYIEPPGEMLVRTISAEDRFTVELIDEGVPFDPLTIEVPDLQASVNDRPIGGLGIFLLRRVMDEVHYNRKENRNILTMIIKKDK